MASSIMNVQALSGSELFQKGPLEGPTIFVYLKSRI